MYRKLKRFDAYQAEYKRMFEETSAALGLAGDAVRAFSSEGKEAADALGIRIEEARAILIQLTVTMQTAQRLQDTSEQCTDRELPAA